MILADKITEERKKNGWSQEELANQLGVSRQAVSKWESAGAVPDVVLLPFTTPETINFLGYQKSKFAGRISGILLIAVGVWMCFIQ